MHLTPRELGEVVVRLELKDGLATAHLIADNRDAGRMLTAAMGDLRTALADRGLRLDSVQVRVSGDAEGPMQGHAHAHDRQHDHQARERRPARRSRSAASTPCGPSRPRSPPASERARRVRARLATHDQPTRPTEGGDRMPEIKAIVPGAGSGDTVSRTDTGGSMGNDTFLKLLVAQMKYQDPLQPTDSAQMMSQLAQFSQVEGLNNLNKQITALGLSQDFSAAVAMIGKTVSYKDAAGDTTDRRRQRRPARREGRAARDRRRPGLHRPGHEGPLNGSPPDRREQARPRPAARATDVPARPRATETGGGFRAALDGALGLQVLGPRRGAAEEPRRLVRRRAS